MKPTRAKLKAGFVPYYVNRHGTIQFMFCRSNRQPLANEQFAICKGTIKPGEFAIQAAIREAKEELGLRQRNIKPKTLHQCWVGKLRGRKNIHWLPVFIAEVSNPRDFGRSSDEIAETKWMTLTEFLRNGRPTHFNVVKKIAKCLDEFCL